MAAASVSDDWNIQPVTDLAHIEASRDNGRNGSRRSLHYLRPFTIEKLDWSGYPFHFPRMTRMGTYADGSCFFHSIAFSYFRPYRRGRVDDKMIDRFEFIRQLRRELSVKLADPVDESDPRSPSYYQTISRGEMESFGREVPQYSLRAMQRELASDRAVDNAYNEFISTILNKDIYLLDATTRDVYVTGEDLDILYKGRDSIVLLYVPGHYELVGIRNDSGDIKTLFTPDHPFIRSIQKRLREKISMGSNDQ